MTPRALLLLATGFGLFASCNPTTAADTGQSAPAVLQDYAVDKGLSEFWIDGECGNPPPWLDVQFITKGDVIPLKKKK